MHMCTTHVYYVGRKQIFGAEVDLCFQKLILSCHIIVSKPKICLQKSAYFAHKTFYYYYELRSFFFAKLRHLRPSWITLLCALGVLC